jgi:hypothetical protein
VYSRLSEYALRRLNFSQRFDSITIQADRSALPPVLLTPFRAGAPHIVQLGPVRIPQPAPPPRDGVQGARRPMGRTQHSRDIRI